MADSAPWADYQPAQKAQLAQSGGPWEDYAKPDNGGPGFLEKMGRSAVNELPAIGGIAGGIIGTPADVVAGPMGNMVGAGIGGYLGTAAKNAINSYIDPAQAPKTTAEEFGQPVMGGLMQAGAQGMGEAVAPYVSKGLGWATDKASDALGDIANEKAIEATGATGKQAAEFAPDAGQQLLDRKIVRFGNSQGKIAQKMTAALEKSGAEIGDTLKGLDASGATLDQADVINSLRKRAVELGDDPAQFGVSDALNKLADRMQTTLEMKGGDSLVPLSKAELTKRGFQNAANYNSSPLDMSVSKEAANVYRQAVEDAASKFSPKAGDVFMKAKKTYSLLNPIEEATTKRALQLAQSPKGGLLDTATAGVGAILGGPSGAMILPAARRVIADRIAPSIAASANLGSKLLGGVSGAEGALTAPALQLIAPDLPNYGLMAPPSAAAAPPVRDYSTVPGRNGH